MSKITESARGEQCQVRLIGICNHNPETVVLAHYRLAGTCGTGIKPVDLQAAYACSSCHDEIDRRTRYLDEGEVKQAFAEGVMRTQRILIEKGLLSVKG